MFDADLLIDCCRLEIDLQIINFLQSSRSSLHHHHQRKLLPICPALLLTLYTNQTPSDTTTGVPSAAPAICIYFNFDKTWGYLEASAEQRINGNEEETNTIQIIQWCRCCKYGAKSWFLLVMVVD